MEGKTKVRSELTSGTPTYFRRSPAATNHAFQLDNLANYKYDFVVILSVIISFVEHSQLQHRVYKRVCWPSTSPSSELEDGQQLRLRQHLQVAIPRHNDTVINVNNELA
ncbi:hypothetical protein HK102_004692 [Quaeritorhiza haematococci]|nr:hypothetical protein HK102_004692 [Quaeritorhiza haematococci]